MKKWNVLVGMYYHGCNRQTVEAATAEEACAKAIEAADQDSNWRNTDDVTTSFVDAIAEGEDADPFEGDADLLVPPAFTDTARMSGVSRQMAGVLTQVDWDLLSRQRLALGRLLDEVGYPTDGSAEGVMNFLAELLRAKGK